MQSFTKLKLSLYSLLIVGSVIFAIPGEAHAAPTLLTSQVEDIGGTLTVTPIETNIYCDSTATTSRLTRWWLNSASTTGSAEFGSSVDCISNVYDYADINPHVLGLTDKIPGTYNYFICKQGNFSNTCWTDADYYMSVYWDGATATPQVSGETTRIVEIISPTPEEVYFIDPDISATYYVNSNDVDNLNNIYIEFGYNSVKSFLYGQTEDTNYSGLYEDQITIFDEVYFYNDGTLNTLTATGTYSAYFQIYERVEPSWWKFWDTSYQKRILAEQKFRFFNQDETDALELAAEYEKQRQIAIEEQTACIDDYTSTACLKENINNAVNAIIYAPPLGYAVFLVKDVLLATTTATDTIAISLNFPSTSPAYGTGITLDISGEIANSISYLDNITLPLNTGSVFDNLMDYWIWFLRIMLGFYILKRVLTLYDLSLSYNKNGGNYQKQGSVNIQSYD